jgi:hypothetical protein
MMHNMTGLQALDQLSTTGDNRLRKFGAILLFILLGYWSYQLLQSYSPGQAPWIFLDYINLAFHEAGHWIWLPLGQFWSVLGGSLTQVLIPVIVLIVFIRQHDLLGVGFGTFWVGNNLINVSYYISDAPSRMLPLLGGDGTIHDWNWILSQMGWLNSSEVIAMIVRVCGSGIVLLAIGCVMLGLLSMRQNRVSV